MINQETVNAAHEWYRTGVRRIGNDTISLGLTYLDKAIAVFAEAGDLRMLTYTRHHRLLGFKLDERDEEVASQYPEVMSGYTALDDSYGKALVLTHLAESLAHQGRWARALSHFNLAGVLAENDGHAPLHAYILERAGCLHRDRENQVQAVRLFAQAEELASEHDLPVAFSRYRTLRAQALAALGETGEAVALLEDVQSRLIGQRRFRDSLEPLTLLRRLYEASDMEEDKNRVVRLMHLSGQELLKTDSERKPSIYSGPPIDRPA